MPDPGAALAEMQRVLKPEGLLFLSVDLGGEPTPDEPIVFSASSLVGLVSEGFEILERREGGKPHSRWRDSSVRLLGRRRPPKATASAGCSSTRASSGGVSSGAAVHVAARIARELDEGVVVTVLADGGWKYLSAGFGRAARRRRALDG